MPHVVTGSVCLLQGIQFAIITSKCLINKQKQKKIRAEQECVEISLGTRRISVEQSGIGMIGISGVVWDAGLLLSDFLFHIFHSPEAQEDGCAVDKLGDTLDLGCGTGIVGMAALTLGATSVVFSDAVLMPTLLDNIAATQASSSQSVFAVRHEWANGMIPELLRPKTTTTAETETPPWDTVICSDVLYEQKSHSALMTLLQSLRFQKLILSYKRRHDVPEQQFLSELTMWCDVFEVDLDSVPIVNIPRTFLVGLHIFVAIPIPV